MPREQFQLEVIKPDLSRLRQSVRLAKAGDSAGFQQIRAAMSWAAFACPGDIRAVFDCLSNEWLGADQGQQQQLCQGSGLPIGESFWAAYWSLIDDAEKGFDAVGITLRAASLAAYVDSGYSNLACESAREYRGYSALNLEQTPARIDLGSLSKHGTESLAMDLYRMWVDNGYDPEVLDRDAIGLGELPVPLRFLNIRILQMHDVWHLVAGYRTTALHEIAISGFQLAQFGHNYSAMFLSAIFAITLERSRDSTDGARLLLQIISESWTHGCQTPPMMAVDWEGHWHKSVATIRSELGIQPFTSLLPADLFEQLNAA